MLLYSNIGRMYTNNDLKRELLFFWLKLESTICLFMSFSNNIVNVYAMGEVIRNYSNTKFNTRI